MQWSGLVPSLDDVQLWLQGPTPVLRLRGQTLVANADADGLSDWSYDLQEDLDRLRPNIDHLEDLGWIKGCPYELTITKLGRAILAAADRAQDTEEGSVVILDSDDQFAYAKLIGHLTQAGQGLLVDPYFRLAQLMTILDGTKLSRILLSKQHKSSSRDRAELQMALASPALPRSVEIRASDDDALHDRLIVDEGGEVWVLGASLNSVGRANTVIVRIPAEGAPSLREKASRLWEQADHLRPLQ